MFRNPVTDLIVVVIVALLIFGPKRLPMLGRSLGQGFREFKDGITGDSEHEADERPELGAADADAASSSTAPASAAPPERESAEVGPSEHRA